MQHGPSLPGPSGPRYLRPGALALALLALAGCQKDAITSYSVPRTDPNEPRLRMLAVVVPADKDTSWFIKYSGAIPLVARHEDEFDRFLATFEFPEGDIKWKLPEGWIKKGATQFRHATIVLPDQSEITISKASGSVLKNVNRWRGQVGLDPIKAADLDATLKKLPLAGGKAVRLDLSGPGPKPGGGMALAPFNYELPEGWKLAPPAPLSIFTVAAGTAQLTVTVAGGDLTDNVNRWRGQIGLDKQSAEQVKAAVQERKVAGRTSQVTDLVGPQETILAAIVPYEGEQLFIKVRGANAAVAAQKAAFDRFLASLQFDAEGANDGK